MQVLDLVLLQSHLVLLQKTRCHIHWRFMDVNIYMVQSCTSGKLKIYMPDVRREIENKDKV